MSDESVSVEGVSVQAEPEAVFDATGPLARTFAAYAPRAAQRALSRAIRDTLEAGEVLIAEAGTGIGKTWAYLVPALSSARKTLISTGTRTLQDQLFQRDIPRLREALGLPVNAAVLKGRSNYVCHYYLERLEQDARGLESREEAAQLRAIRRFTRVSKTGDRADLPEVPEQAAIWNRVTSTRENCLGQDCPFFRECFLMKARRRAQEADVVVVNHALFMADLALQEQGASELLPETALVVFDEAHQLPETATRFLGETVTLHQCLDACRLAKAAGLAHARETVRWSDLCGTVETAARELHRVVAPIGQRAGQRALAGQVPQADRFDEALAAVQQSLVPLGEALSVHAERHADLEVAARTVQALHVRLSSWANPDQPQAAVPASADPFEAAEPVPQLDAGVPSATVRWVECTPGGWRLHQAPLSVADRFSGARRPGQAWILTSATLSLKGDFSHFQRRLGLEDARTGSWPSPFDYAHQGLLYVPQKLPRPSDAGFADAFVQALLPLVRACRGGVLVLCTTLRAVDDIADRLVTGLAPDGRLVMRQGEASRGLLLTRLREQGDAVLVGSTSFWEGVDVPGSALTLVAIDKLPFAPPDDPVLSARLDACRSEGGNPFMEVQLPQAALLLKQGAGRLIRSEQDQGVLMVGDGRLVDRSYGRRLWQGLPPFSRTRDAAVAADFLARAEIRTS